MKLSDISTEKIVGWSLIVGIAANTIMCLNLYRQIGNLEYKVNQLDSNLYSAIQSLSTDLYSLKNSKPYNHTGQFE